MFLYRLFHQIPSRPPRGNCRSCRALLAPFRIAFIELMCAVQASWHVRAIVLLCHSMRRFQERQLRLHFLLWSRFSLYFVYIYARFFGYWWITCPVTNAVWTLHRRSHTQVGPFASSSSSTATWMHPPQTRSMHLPTMIRRSRQTEYLLQPSRDGE